MSPRRTETLLVLACAAAAALLAASQFTNLFELTPPGGEALGEINAADQHGYATLIVAALALVLLVVALAARGEALAQGACFGVAVCGVIALLIFLVIDLPDVEQHRRPRRRLLHRRQGRARRGLLVRAGRLAGADRVRRRAGDDAAGARPFRLAPDENRQGRREEQASEAGFEPSESLRG